MTIRIELLDGEAALVFKPDSEVEAYFPDIEEEVWVPTHMVLMGAIGTVLSCDSEVADKIRTSLIDFYQAHLDKEAGPVQGGVQ